MLPRNLHKHIAKHWKRSLHITGLLSGRQGAGYRVAARVNGTGLWFDSDDAPLEVAPEAFAGLYMLPAASLDIGLRTDEPLSDLWLRNVREMLPVFHEWFSVAPAVSVSCPDGLRARGRPPESRGTGLCFSGGVDSFYNLLKYGRRIDALIFVRGFDIPYDDEVRFGAFEPGLRKIAGTMGCRLVVARTNLRLNPLFAPFNWEMTHGAALAAVGHMLRGTISRLWISASFPREYQRPWGTSRRTDPLWSSERLQVQHVGDEMWRSEKLAEIAHVPLVQRYLRVCWENRSPHGNCCRCEKCVRTMLSLAVIGRLDDFTAFASRSSLARCVRSLDSIDELYRPVYESFLGRGLPGEVEKEIESKLCSTVTGRP
ncbi:MAG: hypothetical protein PVJ36_00670 [Nitrospirota bacterium]|jgi:hypothetical protein